MARIRPLTEGSYLQLLQLASGLLKSTDGDIVQAMRLALPMHTQLLQTIRDEEIRSDLGPGDVVLFVPEEGGLAVRVERHPAGPDQADSSSFDDGEITGFEVTESYSSHYSVPRFDGGVLEDWD